MTQQERISQYMDDFGSITPIQAFRDLGITRLAARISEMIQNGHQITKQTETATNRYGEKIHFTRYSKAV